MALTDAKVLVISLDGTCSSLKLNIKKNPQIMTFENVPKVSYLYLVQCQHSCLKLNKY